MYDETFEDKQKFFEKIKDPTEFEKFKSILGNSACFNSKEIAISDGPYKTYYTNTSYNPYSTRFESVMNGRTIIVPEGEVYEETKKINLKEKRAKEIAEVLKIHIGERICTTCPFTTNCKLDTGVREITKTEHGSDLKVGTGFYAPVVIGLLDTNSL